MSSVAKYTRLVLLGKNFLWILSAGIIALVVWIASTNNSDNGGRMVFTNVPKSAELENLMQKPRYQGVDVHNRPYTIEANNALQKDKDTIILEKVSADMTGDNNAWIAIKSGSGVLNTTTKQMELQKGVEIFYEGGYQFRTDHAHVDIGKGSATGDSRIEGQGGAGTLEAKSFSIVERGNIINFNGSVRMLLYH
jgi:lipopolysaccharide export system protein LptC